MLVLGIDPGYAIVGYGLVKYQRNSFYPIDFGTITTPAKTEFSLRLEIIYDKLINLIQTHKPDALAIEKLYFNTNTTTALDVAQARGIILLAAQKCAVPVFEYTPLQVKQAVTGYGKADKNQVIEMTRRILNLEKTPHPDDAADALAIAICHAHSASSVYFRIGR